MDLKYALEILARRYRKVASTAEGCAIRAVVAQAIANDEIGIPCEKELRERVELLLNDHLYLYAKQDRDRKKKLHRELNLNKIKE